MMQATSDNSDRRNSLHRFRTSLKRKLPLMTVLFLLDLFGYPLLYTAPLFARSEDMLIGNTSIALIVLIFSDVVLVGGAYAASYVSFEYLFKKPQADMTFSLPVSRRSLFICDFLSGLTIYTLPLILSQIAGIAGYHAAASAKDDISVITPEFEYLVNTVYSSAAQTIIPIAVFTVMSGIMAYTISVFTAAASGNKDISACLMCANLFIIPLAEAAVIHSAFTDIYGADPSLSYSHIIPYTSPAGTIYFNLINSLGYNHYLPSVTKITYPLLMSAVSMIYVFFAYRLYRKRKGEQSGSKYISPAVLIFFACISAAAGAFLLSDSRPISDETTDKYFNILLFVIAMAVCAAAVIFSRKKKLSAAFAAAALAVSSVSCFTVRATEHFGADKAVPDINDIASAEISWNDSFTSIYDVSYDTGDLIIDGLLCYGGKDAPDATGTYTESPYDIAVITDWHRYCADSRPESLYKVRIKYTLRNGSAMVRTYCLDNTGYDMLKKLDMSDAFREKRAERYAYYIDQFSTSPDDLSHIPDAIRDMWDIRTLACAPVCNRVKDLPSEAMIKKNSSRFSAVYDDAAFSFDETDTYRTRRADELPDDFSDKLKAALRQDIYAETEEQFHNGGSCYLFAFNGVYNSIPIPAHYTNTLSYLRECGFENAAEYSLPSYEEISEYAGRIQVHMISNAALRASQPDAWKPLFMSRKSVTGFLVYSRTYSTGLCYPENSISDEKRSMICEIIAHSSINKLPDDDDFILDIGDFSYVVDDEYKDMARQLFVEQLAVKLTEYEESDNGDNNDIPEYYRKARELYPEAEDIMKELGDNND